MYDSFAASSSVTFFIIFARLFSLQHAIEKQVLGLAFEGRKKLVFLFFGFFVKFRQASGEPSLGFGAPFWAPGGTFTARGLEKRKKPKQKRHPHVHLAVVLGFYTRSLQLIDLLLQGPFCRRVIQVCL